MIGLRKLSVVLWGGVRRLASLRGRLLGLALLAEGSTNVAAIGGTVFEEVLCLSPCNGQGALSAFWKCSGRAQHP
jgi:hypothetical protein